MLDINVTAIPTPRLEQLLKAENDANMLKAVIENAYQSYDTIDRTTLKILHTMFIGDKEEE